MAHLLADETLKDVLCRVLDVPDTDFASVAPTSPFALRQFSNSDVLLVCKRWMRVATPLLYHTVVLRSVAQAQSLARALKKNPEFGPFLKKLRIEGAFGASVGKIMLFNGVLISDLVLSFTLASGDNVTSMCAALASLRPRRLVLVGDPHFGRIATRNLGDSLIKALPHWTTLTCIVFPCRYLRIWSWLREVLASAQNLPEVVVDGHPGGHHSARSELVKVLSSLPSIQTIRMKAEALVANLDVAARILEFGDLYPKMVFPNPAVRDSTPALFPCGTELSIHSAPLPIQRDVWKRILRHVLFSAPTYQARRGTAAFIALASDNQDLTSVPGALRLMRVCKMFKDILIDLAVHAVALTTPERWHTISILLDARPTLALSTRGLFLASRSVNEAFERSILTRFSNVRRVAVESMGLADANKFHINSLLLLAGTAWASLEQLEIRSLQNAPISSPLRFHNLVRLQIGRFDHRLGTPVWDLPELEELNLDPTGSSVLRSIVHAELPRLRYFAVEGEMGWCNGGVRDDRNEDTVYPFLRKHGSKLVEVRISKCLPEIVLSTCPNLRVYRLSEGSNFNTPQSFADEIPGQVSRPPFENMTTPHASVVSLVLPQYYNYARPREQGYITAWEALFDSLAIGRDGPTPSADCLFPSLVDVKIWGWKWPTAPHDIQHSKMVKWAEGIYSKGIKVLAYDNTPWRPRVKQGR